MEILRLLRAGGVADEACAWAIELFGQHIASSALENAMTHQMPHQIPHQIPHQMSHDQPADTVAAQLDDLHSTLPEEEYPTMRALSPLLTSGDPASRAAWKLRVLIDGILAQAR